MEFFEVGPLETQVMSLGAEILEKEGRVHYSSTPLPNEYTKCNIR